jgi:sugar transferase (PEP-CTERM/EpsH1 system associated)
MNILFVTKELPYPPNNGHRIRSYNIIRGLSKNNAVILFAFGDQEKEAAKLAALQQYCVSIKVITLNRKGPKYFSLFGNLFSPLPYGVKKRYSSLMKDSIKKYLQTSKIDIICCDSIYQSLHIPFNTSRKILFEHNIESVILRRYSATEKNLLKKLYIAVQAQKMDIFQEREWNKFDGRIVVSEDDHRIMSSRVKSAGIDVIPNGVDTTYYSPQNVQAEQFCLVFSGQMDWFANEDAVLYFSREIYPHIKKRIPNVTFWIVGRNPTKKIENLAQKDKSIIITGFVKDVRSYIATSKVVIVPLRIGSGTRLKILEAMAMGKAIVSTKIGCEGLDVTDGENILMADKPLDFAQKIIELFENPSMAKKLEQAGRKLVEEKYSWDKIIRNLNTTINNLF